jgi:hypothetical protein|tara:strand:- start:3120 stop:3311 length:192 start_codon:yes stop_codon:yes gene_type:complete
VSDTKIKLSSTDKIIIDIPQGIITILMGDDGEIIVSIDAPGVEFAEWSEEWDIIIQNPDEESR